MPATLEGVRSLLANWLYGMVRAAEILGNDQVFMRTAEEESLARWRRSRPPARTPTPSSDPVDAAREYQRDLGREGFIDERDVRVQGAGGGLRVEIGASCPYRETCTWRHDEGRPVFCFRGIGTAETLRVATGRSFDVRLEAFGVPCKILLRPIELGDEDHGDEEDPHVH